MTKKKKPIRTPLSPSGAERAGRPRCGLCGKTARLIKTDCCDQWICGDEDEYVLFSFARNSCSRNHRRFTLCGYHDAEGHEGQWQDCAKCRQSFETEIYVYYGTNAYNFVKLENPPEYEPTRCVQCGRVIVLGEDGYSVKGQEYRCEECTNAKFAKAFGMKPHR